MPLGLGMYTVFFRPNVVEGWGKSELNKDTWLNQVTLSFKMIESAEKSAEKSADSSKNLEKRFEQILGHMQDDIEYSCDEIVEAIGLKSPRTRQILNELVSMNKIITSGATKGRRYIKKSAEK